MIATTKTLSLAGLILQGQVASTQYSLKFTPKEGSSLTFKFKGEMDIQGVSASLDSTVVQKILKVDPDGTYTLQSNTIEGKVIYSGQEMAVPKNVSVTIFKQDGEVVSVSGEQVDPTSLRSQNLVMLKRPDNMVKVNDTWTVEVKGDASIKKPSLHGTFKLVGEEMVGAYHTLRVDANMSEGDVTLAGTATSSFWLNKEDGSVVKYECKYANMPLPGAPSPMSGSFSMIRVDK